ncbi:hypothetical protein JTB14_001868 [Gonioctena quinquepunctata]|nr:hypothetical protein JTB14_001868 [Gonioctena quinquepunctata]
MKKFVILAVFLFAFAYANSESKSPDEEDNKELAELVRDILNITVINDPVRLDLLGIDCPIEGAIAEIGVCIQNNKPDSPCKIYKCAKPAIRAIISCLPIGPNFIVNAAVKLITAAIDKACDFTSKQVLELFNPCMFEEDFDKYAECREIITFLKENKDKASSENLACSLLPKMNGCMKARQEASCKNPETKQAIALFSEVIEYATQKDCDTLNEA